MIVRDDQEYWQIVLQPDHAELAGDFAAAWGEAAGFAPPQRPESVVRASARHDDGWLAWEREPVLHPDTGAPKSFTQVPTSWQMDFYRGCIAALDDIDPYAALLTSMHACGLYGADYGWLAPPVSAAYHADAARFVAEYHPTHERRRADLGLDEAEVLRGYHILEAVDRLSLYYCMRPDGAPYTIQRVVLADGREAPLEIAPVAPGVVSLAPFPFVGDRAEFSLRRRLMPKRTWPDVRAFRTDFFATEIDVKPIVLVRAES